MWCISSWFSSAYAHNINLKQKYQKHKKSAAVNGITAHSHKEIKFSLQTMQVRTQQTVNYAVISHFTAVYVCVCVVWVHVSAISGSNCSLNWYYIVLEHTGLLIILSKPHIDAKFSFWVDAHFNALTASFIFICPLSPRVERYQLRQQQVHCHARSYQLKYHTV